MAVVAVVDDGSKGFRCLRAELEWLAEQGVGGVLLVELQPGPAGAERLAALRSVAVQLEMAVVSSWSPGGSVLRAVRQVALHPRLLRVLVAGHLTRFAHAGLRRFARGSATAVVEVCPDDARDSRDARVLG